MSLESVAQESALRLLRPIIPLLSADELTAKTSAAAAAAAATAARGGASDDVAVSQGEAAGMAAKAEATKAAEPVVPTVASGPLSTLVKYIPTETISLYIAIQAALGDVTVPKGKPISDADFSSRWAWLGIMFAATLLLATALAYRAQKNVDPTGNFKWPLFDVSASGVAFLVWALSLPTTPLRDFAGYDYSAWNSVLILGGTVAIAVAAYALGKTVAWSKVLTDS